MLQRLRRVSTDTKASTGAARPASTVLPAALQALQPWSQVAARAQAIGAALPFSGWPVSSVYVGTTGQQPVSVAKWEMVAAVPEPSSIALFALALGGLGLTCRLRRGQLKPA